MLSYGNLRKFPHFTSPKKSIQILVRREPEQFTMSYARDSQYHHPRSWITLQIHPAWKQGQGLSSPRCVLSTHMKIFSHVSISSSAAHAIIKSLARQHRLSFHYLFIKNSSYQNYGLKLSCQCNRLWTRSQRQSRTVTVPVLLCFNLDSG